MCELRELGYGHGRVTAGYFSVTGTQTGITGMSVPMVHGAAASTVLV